MTEPHVRAGDRPEGQAVVVVGASAGGVEALIQLAGTLPDDFPLPVVVVLHVAPTATSVLPHILTRAGRLPAVTAMDGDELVAGRLYVAPPDLHLLVQDGRLRLSQAPRENGHRPAIDPTMRSAAAASGPAAVGVVLSGSRDDGTQGLMAIKAAGGATIVQDPEEAIYDAMPRNALAHVDVDAVLPIRSIAQWILARDDERTATPSSPGEVQLEVLAEDAVPASAGEGTRYTCPDCGGVLFAHREEALERFKCSVGHAFTIESLSDAQAHTLESALWAAVRSLEDRASLLERMAGRARTSGRTRSAASFHSHAEDALRRARTIQGVIEAVPAVGEEAL